MAFPLLMPRLGLTMEQGTVVAWPKAPGDRVEKGEIVLVIETEKSEVEIEAAAGGFLRHLYAQPGETLPPGALLAALTATDDEAFDEAQFAAEIGAAGGGGVAADGGAAAAAGTVPPAAARLPARAAAGRPAGRVVSTPRARRLAEELGVELAGVAGSGPGGRITEEDVRAAAAGRQGGGELMEVGGGVELEVFDTAAGATEASAAGPVIVLLPGFGSDLSVLSAQAEALAREHRVIGIHARGTARSTAPALDLYRVEDGAADALAVIRRKGVDRVSLLGASLGAAVALELALAAPERVASLVLVTPFLTACRRLLLVLDLWTELVRSGDRELGARALLPWLFSDAFLDGAGQRDLAARGLARMLARTPAPALERWGRGIAAWSGTRARDLSALAAPTVVLHGGSDLLATEHEAAWSSAPAALERVVPGTGHALALEAPGEVTAAVLGQLRAARR